MHIYNLVLISNHGTAHPQKKNQLLDGITLMTYVVIKKKTLMTYVQRVQGLSIFNHPFVGAFIFSLTYLNLSQRGVNSSWPI